MSDLIRRLNQEFALPNHLSFTSGPGDLPIAVVENEYASAQISLLGAHLLSFQPRDERPMVWSSPTSSYQVGQPIRGGIPICWPWFAGHPTDDSKPAHGFVRTMAWTVTETRVLADGATRIVFGLASNPDTLALWPHPFRLRHLVTVGASLHVELVTHNTGPLPFSFTGALHTYFAVGVAGQITIRGLEGADYLDKRDEMQRKRQVGPVTIQGWTDRIYLDSPGPCAIQDPVWERTVHIYKVGSRSTVLWNPWSEGAQRLPDFPDDGYSGMVCVETAKAAEDVAEVEAGGEHRLQARIWLS